jgi:hypothetical protein
MLKKLFIAAGMMASATTAHAMDVTTFDRVQSYVNKNVAYKQDKYGTDIWEEAKKSGDCEDLAILKRNLLIAEGWDADDLKIIIIVKNIPGRNKTVYEGHVVLKSIALNRVLDMPIIQRLQNSRTQTKIELMSVDYNVYMAERKFKFFCVVGDYTTRVVANASDRCIKRLQVSQN